jgi:pimeloyl-ACP methyl ester carboxylesterase
MGKLTPFAVEWSEADVAGVLEGIRAYPWPPIPKVADGWAYGCDGAFLQGLCAYWLDGYDWRAAVAELNRYPQYLTRVGDFDLHFVHVVGEAEGRRPLLLSHGWPGSHYEFWGAIDKLAFPSRHGGAAADAFDLVIPSLPGFGFSSKPERPFGQRATARLFNELMRQLGYQRYLAQGGDWGALVTSWLGLDQPAHVRAIHLNMMGLRPSGGPQSQDEIAWMTRTGAAMDQLGAYFRLQASKPQSLAWLGAGNPVGQAAWIVERFYDWCDRRETSFERVFTRDQLLTNIMIYVMTGSFTTGAWYYRAFLEEGGIVLQEGQRCEVPTAFANFPGEALYSAPPRSWAERAYNIARWTDMPRGGHFAAMEQPDLFVEDVRAWAREVA